MIIFILTCLNLTTLKLRVSYKDILGIKNKKYCIQRNVSFTPSVLKIQKFTLKLLDRHFYFYFYLFNQTRFFPHCLHLFFIKTVTKRYLINIESMFCWHFLRSIHKAFIKNIFRKDFCTFFHHENNVYNFVKNKVKQPK